MRELKTHSGNDKRDLVSTNVDSARVQHGIDHASIMPQSCLNHADGGNNNNSGASSIMQYTHSDKMKETAAGADSLRADTQRLVNENTPRNEPNEAAINQNTAPTNGPNEDAVNPNAAPTNEPNEAITNPNTAPTNEPNEGAVNPNTGTKEPNETTLTLDETEQNIFLQRKEVPRSRLKTRFSRASPRSGELTGLERGRGGLSGIERGLRPIIPCSSSEGSAVDNAAASPKSSSSIKSSANKIGGLKPIPGATNKENKIPKTGQEEKHLTGGTPSTSSSSKAGNQNPTGNRQKNNFPHPLEALGLKVINGGLTLPETQRSRRRRLHPKDPKKEPKRFSKSVDYGIEGDLFKAVIRNDLAAVEAILPLCDTKSPRNPADMDRLGKGATPLHIAADRGFKDITKKLIAEGAMINLPTLRGLTPLHCAAQGGHVDVVQILVTAGAQTTCKTLTGATAKDLSAKCGDQKSRKRLAHVLGQNDIYGRFGNAKQRRMGSTTSDEMKKNDITCSQEAGEEKKPRTRGGGKGDPPRRDDGDNEGKGKGKGSEPMLGVINSLGNGPRRQDSSMNRNPSKRKRRRVSARDGTCGDDK